MTHTHPGIHPPLRPVWDWRGPEWGWQDGPKPGPSPPCTPQPEGDKKGGAAGGPHTCPFCPTQLRARSLNSGEWGPQGDQSRVPKVLGTARGGGNGVPRSFVLKSAADPRSVGQSQPRRKLRKVLGAPKGALIPGHPSPPPQALSPSPSPPQTRPEDAREAEVQVSARAQGQMGRREEQGQSAPRGPAGSDWG